MATHPVKSKNRGESVTTEVNLSAVHLRSISNSVSDIILYSSQIEENITSLGIPRDYDIHNDLTKQYVDALDQDFNAISNLFLNRLNQQFSVYKKSISLVKAKFKIFPKELNITEIKSEVTQKFVTLNSFLFRDDTAYSEDFWKDVNLSFEDSVKCYNYHMSQIWIEIEKLDKFRNDHGRYRIAKWGFGVSIFLLVFGQVDEIYNNLIYAFEWIGW